MKHLLVLIFSLVLIQVVWMRAEECIPTDEQMMCQLESATDTEESVISMPQGQTQGKIASTELQSIARHMRTVSFRIQLLSESNLTFIKTLIQRLSQHATTLTTCATHTYSTLRLSSWKVPADCYVFGIRHILI